MEATIPHRKKIITLKEDTFNTMRTNPTDICLKTTLMER